MKYLLRSILFFQLALPFGIMEVRAEEEETPCTGDIAKFCRAEKPGGGRVVSCLKEHEQELTATCRDYQAVLQRKTRKTSSACQDDVEKFCKDVRPVDRRIIRCLQQHEAELSVECRDSLR